jgi:hypothetical protein
MKLTLLFLLSLSLPLNAQVSETDSILNEMWRPLRDTLDSRDRLYLQKQRSAMASLNSDALVDSLTALLDDA